MTQSPATPENDPQGSQERSPVTYNFYGQVGQVMTGDLQVQGDNVGMQNHHDDGSCIKQTGLENVTAGGDIHVTIHQSVGQNPVSEPSRNQALTFRQKIRKQQMDALRQEISLAQQQWESVLDDGQRLRLERQIEQKLQKLEELENDQSETRDP